MRVPIKIESTSVSIGFPSQKWSNAAEGNGCFDTVCVYEYAGKLVETPASIKIILCFYSSCKYFTAFLKLRSSIAYMLTSLGGLICSFDAYSWYLVSVYGLVKTNLLYLGSE